MVKKITPQMEKSIIDFIDEYPTKREAVEAFNAHWKTDFHYRTLTQRYNNMKKGAAEVLEDNYEEKQLERIARAQNRAMIEQKKATFAKADLHKQTREQGLVEIVIDEVKKGLESEVQHKKVERKLESKPDVLEYIISDEHFTGTDDEVLDNVFNAINSDLYFRGLENPEEFTEFRLTFLGDNIEGVAAHKSQLAVAKMVKPTIEYARQLSAKINRLYEGIVSTYGNKIEFTVVFVPESNHGQIRPLSTQRSELPEEDMGYVIQAFLESRLNENIYMYEDKDGIIETNDSFYLHGHQAFAKGKNYDKIIATLGSKKDVIMGHFHSLQTYQKGENLFMMVPSAKTNRYDYEKQAGYNTASAIMKIRRDVRGKQTEWKLMKL